ncbi:NUDIX hydrolase [Sphingomonas oryzagri]
MRQPDAPLQPPIDAASLILMREGNGSDPEYLIAQRSSDLVFAAGAFVFPGGRLDPCDRTEGISRLPHLDPGDAAARIAALRETVEETGIAASREPADLIPFARWLPRHEAVKRRFDTRFYLTRMEERIEPVADGFETRSAFWATAAEILDRCERGDGRIIFPTRRILERLARFATFAEAREEAERLPERIISPWVEQRGDGDWLCIPDDAGYPVTAEPAASAFRY